MLRRLHHLPSSRSTITTSSTLVALNRTFSFNHIFTTKDHQRSLSHPTEFWEEKAKGISFLKEPTQVLPLRKFDNSNKNNFTAQDESDILSWFPGCELNFSFNCLDRHILNGKGNQVAIYYDSAVTGERKAISYNKLFTEVNVLARVLAEDLNVKKGDVVVIYMPNGYRVITAMLACARLGAIHSVVFGGFAAPELAKRIIHGEAKTILTCSGGIENGKLVDYASLVEEALDIVHTSGDHRVEHVLFHQRKASPLFTELDFSTRLRGIGKLWKDLVQKKKFQLSLKSNATTATKTNTDDESSLESSPFYFPPVPVEGNHSLYLLYSSGTTASPKGIIHDTAGMAVMLHSTMKHIFGLDEGDTMMVLSDCGWVVGHSYMIYAPLLKCCATVVFEGKPTNTPDCSTYFRMIQDYKVQVMFTAPTAMRAIRAIDAEGTLAKKYDSSSLKLFFIAGERSDPSTVQWCQKILHGVPVIDNYWQTETAAPISSAPRDDIAENTNMPRIVIGSGGVAAPGWNLVCGKKEEKKSDDDEFSSESEEQAGDLIAKFPLPPGVFTALWKRPGDLLKLYCSSPNYPGHYLTYDSGKIDDQGHVHIMSRSDDVLNVAAHRLSTGQLEQAIALHDLVAESAVVGRPDPLKGQKPVAFVVLKGNHLEQLFCRNQQETELFTVEMKLKELEISINNKLRHEVGPIATADVVVVHKLPKTRSGKVLRKMLREMVAGVEREKLSVSPTIEDVPNVDALYNAVQKHLF